MRTSRRAGRRAGLAMLVILASLGALASFVSHLLLRNRRRMEMIATISPARVQGSPR